MKDTQKRFDTWVTRALEDPTIMDDYKEFLRNCMKMNLDDNLKDSIINQLFNYYLFEAPLQFQPLYSTTSPIDEFSSDIPENIIDNISKMNDALKELHVPSLREIEEMNDITVDELVEKIKNGDKTFSWDSINHNLVLEITDTSDNSKTAYDFESLLGINKRRYSKEFIDSLDDNIDVIKNPTFKDQTKLNIIPTMKRFSYPFSSTMHIHIPDDIYQQPYYRNMSEVECSIAKLEMHNKSFNNHSKSLDNLECNEQEVNEDMLAELDIMPLYLHSCHWNKIINTHNENAKSDSRSQPTFFEWMASKSFSVPITALNITELCGCSSGTPNPNGNRATRRKTKKKR